MHTIYLYNLARIYFRSCFYTKSESCVAVHIQLHSRAVNTQVASDGTISRRFSTGTNVTWSPHRNPKGRIHWAGDPSPSPSPPSPSPSPSPPSPSPSPSPRPTPGCPQIFVDCGWQHFDLAKATATSWAECCSICSARKGCSKWVFFGPSALAQNKDGQCRLHGPNATHHSNHDAGKVCGTVASHNEKVSTVGTYFDFRI